MFQAIDRTILETIVNCDKIKDIRDSMCRKYQGSTKVKRAQLKALCQEFYVLCVKDNEIVDEYSARTLDIANEMST